MMLRDIEGWLGTIKRKAFELGCWCFEPMVPKRLMDDRLERERRVLEKHQEVEIARIADLKREIEILTTAKQVKQPDPPRPRTWWPCGSPF